MTKRAELDGTQELAGFARTLEKATLDTIENGLMTADLARIAKPEAKQVLNSQEFIGAVQTELDGLWQNT